MVSMEAPEGSGDADAEFWSQAKAEEAKPTKSADETVDTYGDALNKASNEDIYAFSEVASSEEGVTTYLKNAAVEPTIDLAAAEGDPAMMAQFMGDLASKSGGIQPKDLELLRKSMGLKT